MIHVRSFTAFPSVLAGSALASLAPFAASQSPPIFGQPAPSYATNGTASQLVVADLDRDGNLDVVANSPVTGRFGVRLGDGAGGFGAEATFPSIGPIALGDLDGDGVPDLATVSSLASSLEVRLGDGSGGFGAPSVMPVGFPTSVALGDVNVDGLLDAVIGAGEPLSPGTMNVLHVALGDGLGGFGAPTHVQGPGSNVGIQLVDWNHDGALDATTIEIVVVSKSLVTRLGNGAGEFGAPSEKVLTNADFTTVGFSNGCDVNGDGSLDVATSVYSVVTNLTFGGVALGDGAGHFPTSVPAGFFGAGTISPTLGDVDGNGKCDLLLTAPTAGNVQVRPGDGAGGFGFAIVFAAGTAPAATVLADLDGNGRLDGLTINAGSQDFSVLKNQLAYPAGIAPFGAGTFGCSGVHGISATSAPYVGNIGFAIATTGAPAYSAGLVVIGDAASASGYDPLGIGVDFHVDLAASSSVFTFNAASDANGYALASIPLPATPALAGVTAAAQTFWFWPACAPSPFHLSSSRGLAVTFQP